jgi:LPS-assembly protein
MYYSKIIILAAFFLWVGSCPSLGLSNTTPYPHAANQIVNSELANLTQTLGWTKSSLKKNLCHGIYALPHSPIPCFQKPFADNDYHLKSSETIYDIHTDRATLKNICLGRLDHQLTAKIAHLHRSKKNHQIHYIDASRNIDFIDPHKFIRAQQAQINFITHTVTLHDVIYRIILGEKYQQHAWGKAHQVIQQRTKTLTDLYQTTYTTCSPTNKTWSLSAHHIQLNQKKGRGYAKHTILRLYQLPIFYFPYLNFPIDRQRQTGFLFPFYRHTTHDGFTLAFPFYWNLASNYDTLTTLYAKSKRGLFLDTRFRYLTRYHQGKIDFNIIPSDHAFKQFKQDALIKYAGNPNLIRLNKANKARAGISIRHHAEWSPHWKGQINYQAVSDDYYYQNFGSSSHSKSEHQLLQQAQLSYKNTSTNLYFNLQRYQSLHPVNRARIDNQYAKLPQMVLDTHLPSHFHGFDIGLRAEGVRFDKIRSLEATTDPILGNRYSFKPFMSLPLHRTFGYLHPRIQWQLTHYQLRQTPPNQPKHVDYAIPIFDTKAGLYFRRRYQCKRSTYQQTLEPTLYYLYIPFRQQYQLPLFDTTARLFTYENLFHYNRFSGLDRIGDTHQITWGLTTRFINEGNGTQKASASIGQSYYLTPRHVTLCSGQTCQAEPTDKHKASPIAMKGTYKINASWQAQLGLAWDNDSHTFAYRHLGMQYQPDLHHVFNIDYTFIGNKRISNDFSSNNTPLTQISLNGAWQLMPNFRLIGQWNYNKSPQIRAPSYLYGIEYESCCWGLRAAFAHYFTGLTADNAANFDNAFYIEFALKGLGQAGNSHLNTLLTQSIDGFIDHFGQV